MVKDVSLPAEAQILITVALAVWVAVQTNSEGWKAVNCDELLVLPYTANLFIPWPGWKYGNASCQILTSHVQNERLRTKASAAAARYKTDFGWDWCAAKSPLKYSGIAWCWITKRGARRTKLELSRLKNQTWASTRCTTGMETLKHAFQVSCFSSKLNMLYYPSLICRDNDKTAVHKLILSCFTTLLLE